MKCILAVVCFNLLRNALHLVLVTCVYENTHTHAHTHTHARARTHTRTHWPAIVDGACTIVSGDVGRW